MQPAGKNEKKRPVRRFHMTLQTLINYVRMKNLKSKLFFMLLVSALCVGFTACDDDDDDDKKTDYAAVIAGTYTGSVKMGEAVVAEDATITITRTAENKVKLSMNQTIMELPIDIECNSDVTNKDGVNSFSGTASITLQAEDGSSLPANVKVDGNVNGSGKATINIVVGEELAEQAPTFPITVVFEGEKK